MNAQNVRAKSTTGGGAHKRLLAIMLALVLSLGMLPAISQNAYAATVEVEVDLSTSSNPTQAIQDAIDADNDVVIKLIGGSLKSYSDGQSYGEPPTPSPGLNGSFPTFALGANLIVPLGKNITIKSDTQVVIKAKEESRHIVVGGSGAGLTSITFDKVVLYGHDDGLGVNTNTGGIAFNGLGIETLTLDGAHIAHCTQVGAAYVNGNGAGVYADGKLILKNSIIHQNEVRNGNGGGVYQASDAEVIVINSLFFRNFANTISSIPAETAGHGGGIYSESGNVRIESNSLITTNYADITYYSGNGAGVYAKEGNVTVNGDSEISDNYAPMSGGGIYAKEGNVNIESGSIIRNHASNGSGGGIYAGSGDVYIDDSLITKNDAYATFKPNGNGGGIYASTGDVTIVGDTTISFNTALNGGGIYTKEGDVNIDDSLITKNDAWVNGGGLYVGSGNLNIENSTISDNRAGTSGGGVAYFSLTGTTTVANSEIINNEAEGLGGGIYNDYGILIIEDSTIKGNKASSSGGIHTDGDTTVKGDTVIRGNTTTDVQSSAIGYAYEPGVDFTLSIEKPALIEGWVGQIGDEDEYSKDALYPLGASGISLYPASGSIDLAKAPKDIQTSFFAPNYPDSISITRKSYTAPDGVKDDKDYPVPNVYSYDKSTGDITFIAAKLKDAVDKGDILVGEYIFEITAGTQKFGYKLKIEDENAFVPYDIKYLEDGTGDEIAPTKTVKNQKIYSDVYEFAISIAGYTHIKEPNTKHLKLDGYNKEIVFYYVVNPEEQDAIALANAKAKAQDELNDYGTLTDYRPAELAAVLNERAIGRNNINKATSTADVKTALDVAKAAIDKIKTDAQYTLEEAADALAKLRAAQAEARDELAAYKNADDYREAEQAELAVAVSTGTIAINDAVTLDAVATALKDAKAAIDALKTEAQYEAEEAEALDADDTTTLTDAKLGVKSVNAAVKTIYIQKGKTAKIPYVVYANVGYSGKKVTADWRVSTIGKISIGAEKPKQKLLVSQEVKLDAKSVLKIKGSKVGTANLVLKVGTKTLNIKIKIIKKAKVAKVLNYKLNKFTKALKVGAAKTIKVSKINKNAAFNIATFKIAKKYAKYLKVDAAGKLTALKEYKAGKKSIPVKVKVGKKVVTIKIKVKK